MNATADLRSEHVGVGRMLGILDGMRRRLDTGEHVPVDDLEDSIDFLRVFVDACHHGKEEDLLFPAMRAASMTAAEDTIVRLLAEHVRGREMVARIAAAMQQMAMGDGSAATELAEGIAAYTELLHAHIRREENDCFAPADRELPAEVQDRLVEEYERVEREVIGEGRHEAFHAMLDRLEHAYR